MTALISVIMRYIAPQGRNVAEKFESQILFTSLCLFQLVGICTIGSSNIPVTIFKGSKISCVTFFKALAKKRVPFSR